VKEKEGHKFEVLETGRIWHNLYTRQSKKDISRVVKITDQKDGANVKKRFTGFTVHDLKDKSTISSKKRKQQFNIGPTLLTDLH